MTVQSAPSAQAHPTSAHWHLRLLGNLVLESTTRRIAHLPSRAAAALLARLALWPERAHAREELIELLWPGVALDVGRNRLRQTLSSLKSMLEPMGAVPVQTVLLADRLHLRVVAGAVSCDATQFEQHVRAGRDAAAQVLYGGELLPGFYDEWIDAERLRFAALHDRLIARLAGPVAPLPTAPAAMQAASQSAPRPGKTSPGHPGTRAAPGHPGAPRAPAPAEPRSLTALPPARVILPNFLSRMFGADEQAARLRASLLANRFVTLIGPGGAGKTRLAVETAHSLREHAQWPLPRSDPFEPFALIAFVPLVACTTAAQTLDTLINTLRIIPGAEDPLRALTAALADRRALLVLDNCEQLDGAAIALVAQLASGLPALHAVATSRRALGLDGEHEFALAVLSWPGAEASLSEIAANPSVALFVERAQAVRADFHLSARNAPTVVALVRELEGMPLALELAASRVRGVALADMLARLQGPARRGSICCRAPASVLHRTRGTPRCSASSNGAGIGWAPHHKNCLLR